MDPHGLVVDPACAEAEERAYLRRVATVILAHVDRLTAAPRYFPEDSDEPQTADEVAQQAVDAMRDTALLQLGAARLEPYFGRIDFCEQGSAEVEPLYIGKRGIEGEDGDRLVVDWRAPVASMFYSFSGKGESAGYDAPVGRVEGDIHLKRNVLIRNEVLQRVVDSYRKGQEESGVTDEFLLYRLTEQKDSRLRDIVSTIQSEQDQIIRADRQKCVVIQGVAGSGKTTVALHRVAFLLYQHAQRMKAENVAIFAPNALFVDYISEVLPELGVGGILQTTFARWAIGVLGNTVVLKNSAHRLADWFRGQPGNTHDDAFLAAQFKGSEAFLDLLDLQVRQLLQAPLGVGDFEPWEGLVLPAETIRSWFATEYAQLPPIKRRDRVLARIKRWSEMAYRDVKTLDGSSEKKKLAASRFKSYAKRWPEPTVFGLYRSAWEQAGHLGLVGTTAIDVGRRPTVEVEDLAGLVYLHLRLHGTAATDTFDHVVIDEAQDFSPLQIAVLKRYCPSGSFTILGDLAQSIHMYQGITDWNRFMRQFPAEQVAFYALDVSYRSTMEIIEFANDILRQFPGFIPARPVFRSGQPVVTQQVPPKRRLSVVAASVRAHLPHANTIAVVCRTDTDAAEVHAALLQDGIAAHLIAGDQERYAGGVSVLPVYLTKGLEFDVVLILDVDDSNYQATVEHAKLLYVGCSRALHALEVYHGASPSPLIGHAIQPGTQQGRVV